METKNEQSEKFLVRFKNELYDISGFAHKHPGGTNTLKGLNNMNMDERFLKGPPHSDAAMYLMKEYKVKNGNSKRSTNRTKKNGLTNGTPNGKANGVTNGHANGFANGSSNGLVNGSATDLKKEFFGEPDESMEHLVDWSSAMIPQISKLGNTYAKWVNMPVDRPLRLFEPDWIESLTKTPWWVVPAFWIPTICYICRTGVLDAAGKSSVVSYMGEQGLVLLFCYFIWIKMSEVKLFIFKKAVMLLSFAAGLLLWTVIEYCLHRWVFHFNPEGGGPYTCALHFLIHGLHHKVPFDSNRLVFPPVPAILIASVFYLPFPYLFNCPRIAISGGLFGYLCYDMVHYYIHYGSPNGGYFYNLKRYHYQHHFVHHDKGFGVSSPYWDGAFGTKIVLRKLKYLLKW